MKGFELRRWLIESAEEDLWHLSVNGEVYDVTYDLSEISEIAVDFADQDLRVRHASATNADGKSEWVKYELDIKARATNQIMVQNETQADSVVIKNTGRKKNPLTKGHVCVVLASWAILVGWGLKQEHTLNLRKLQVEGLDEEIKLQKDKISSLDSQVDDLQDAQEASDEAIGNRDGFLKEQSAQLNDLNVSYLAIMNVNRRLQNLNSELVADSANRSAMIDSLRNELNQNARQSEALAALEIEKIRLIKQQNAINQGIADGMAADRFARNWKALNEQLNKPKPVYVPALDNTQGELDALKRKMRDLELDKIERENREAGDFTNR